MLIVEFFSTKSQLKRYLDKNLHKPSAMKMKFETRLEAIDWIANYAEDEMEFEELREQLNYNYIYTKELFIDIKASDSTKDSDMKMEIV